MLDQTLIRTPRRPGIHVIQPRGAHGATYLGGWRLHLAPGSSAEHASESDEMIVVLQEGAGTFEAGGQKWDVSRKSVFDERATALYVPPGMTFRATATAPMEAIIVGTPATPGGTPAFVGPGDVQVLARGRDTYAREVHNLFVTDPHARRLMVGETFNPPGHWSSTAAQARLCKNGEPSARGGLRFRVHPPQGSASRFSTPKAARSVTHQVRDGGVVVLRMRYHPVSAPPLLSLLPLGDGGRRTQARAVEDPARTWIHERA